MCVCTLVGCCCVHEQTVVGASLRSHVPVLPEQDYPGVAKATLQICSFIIWSKTAESSFVQSRFAACPLDSFDIMTDYRSLVTGLHQGSVTLWLTCMFWAREVNSATVSGWKCRNSISWFNYFLSHSQKLIPKHQTFFWKILIAFVGTAEAHVNITQNLAASTGHRNLSGLSYWVHVCLCPGSPRGDGA